MFERVALLDPADCAALERTVLSLRRFWTRRHPVLPAFTLGAAAYLDLQEGPSAYAAGIVRGNKLLSSRFLPLYHRIALALEPMLGGAVALTRRYALPGFHIFEGAPGLAEVVPRLHFDLQDLDLDWEDGAERAPSARVSFTVPIALPRAGAGLYFWDVPYADSIDTSERAMRALADGAERHYADFRAGELVLHSGDRLHQIAGDRRPAEGEARMTLQGHARKTCGTWILYW